MRLPDPLYRRITATISDYVYTDTLTFYDQAGRPENPNDVMPWLETAIEHINEYCCDMTSFYSRKTPRRYHTSIKNHVWTTALDAFTHAVRRRGIDVEIHMTDHTTLCHLR